MTTGPPALQIGDFKTLPLYSLKARLKEDLKPFESAKIEVEFPNPDYDPQDYPYKKEDVSRLVEDIEQALHSVDTWIGHLANYQYFVQFFDDANKLKTVALHDHTECVSLIGDSFLTIDTAALWKQFDFVVRFELLHSKYRSDLERKNKYDQYAKQLEELWRGENSVEASTQWLIQRMKSVLELKASPRRHHQSPDLGSKKADTAHRPPCVRLFLSYAHDDEILRGDLEKHLSVLRREDRIAYWHDRRITGGTEWKGAIDRNLEEADLVLLLISKHFFASDYCYDVEMKAALDRHAKGTCRVVPIIISPCDWLNSPLRHLQALPKDGHPITQWKTADEGFLDVVRGLRAVIAELPTKSNRPN